MTDEERELARVTRYVAEGRKIVARRREEIAALEAAGSPLHDKAHALDLFVDTLEMFEKLEHQLKVKVAEKAERH